MILLRIWKQQPGRYFFLSTKDRAGVWKDHPFRRSQFKEVEQFIVDHADKDLYWCPHGFTKPRRLKKFAEIPKLLWADLDEANPSSMGDFIPTVAWESSPGRFAGVWVLDEFMTEDINKRMTYHVGADKGGWDITQVLRIPGTRNYKYASTPKGRLLWSDGPTYVVRDLDANLPKEQSSFKKREGNVALGLYKKYESKFSGYVRRQLLKGKVIPGKRSEVLWKLAHELIEAGCTREEAFELLRVSPWNKFNKRRDGDEQLRRELDKALEQHINVIDDENPKAERFGDVEEEEEDDEKYKFLSRSMESVEEENIDWIWYPYLARGELTILEGDPGLGKSYLAQMVAAAICDGGKLPSVKRSEAVQGKVAYFDIENASGSVTKKRLATNGLKNMKDFYQEEEPFSVDDDETLDTVYQAIDALRPTLVVFDTVNTYLGSADTHKASETQQAFKRFLDIARRFHCSVLVLRHLTKSTKERAIYRGQGSIAFTGLARVVMTVGVMPDEPSTRVMAITKINVTRAPKALAFTIEALPDTLKEQDRSRFVWGDFVDLSADEILVGVSTGSNSGAAEELNQVVDWLSALLENGPEKYAAIQKAASMRSYTDKMLDQAALLRGITRDGEGKGSWWSLPTSEEG